MNTFWLAGCRHQKCAPRKLQSQHSSSDTGQGWGNLAKIEDLGTGNVIKAAGSSYQSGWIRKIIFFQEKQNPSYWDKARIRSDDWKLNIKVELITHFMTITQLFSNMAAPGNHPGGFKNQWSLDVTPRESDLIGLGRGLDIRIFTSLLR